MANILIVDDDRHFIQQVRKLLSTFDWASDFVIRAEHVLPKLGRNAFDLILLDINMPGTHGVTLLTQLKAHPVYQAIPVIMVTVEADDHVLAECFQHGATDFITKPVKELVFKARIQSALTTQAYIRQIQQQKETLQQRTAELNREIIERKRVEKALQENERKLFTLMNNLPGMAYRCLNDRNWTMEFVSEGCYELTGYKPSDLIGNQTITYSDLFHPNDQDPIWDQVQEALAERQPFQLVYRIQTRSGREKWVWEQGIGVFSGQENLLALEGFITDITGRKRMEVALRESEERFHKLFENSPDAIFVENVEGTVLEVNPAACRLHGMERAELVGKNVLELVPPDRREKLSLEYPDQAKGEQKRLESFSWTKDGRAIPVEISINNIDYANQPALLLHVRDITERKKMEEELQRHRDHLEELVEERTAELVKTNEQLQQEIIVRMQAQEALRESEERYRTLIESSFDHIFMLDREGLYLSSNGQVKHLGFINSKSLAGCHLRDIYPPVVTEFYQQQLAQVFATGQVVTFEHPMPLSDGEHYHFDTLYPLWKDDEVWAVGGICRDITEHKQAEEALRESEERFSLFMDYLPAVVFIKDAESRTLFVNKHMRDVLGAKDWIGKTALELFPKDIAEPMIADDKKALSDGYQMTVETVPHEDGTEHIYQTQKFALKRPDKAPLLGGIALDITERVRAEEALRESEEKLRSTISSIDDLVFTLDKNGVFLDYYQPANVSDLYAPPEVFLGKPFKSILPPHTAKLLEDTINAVAATNAVQQVDYPAIIAGRERWFNARVSMRKDSAGEFAGVTIVSRNITDRKRMEDKLKEAEERYRTLFEQSPDAVMIIDPETMLPIEFNERMLRLLGYSREEFAELPIPRYEVIESLEETKAHIEKVLREGQDEFETKFRTKKGEIRDVIVSIQTLELSGRIVFHNIVHDITERKQAEEQIKASLREKEVLLKEIHHRVKNNLQVIASLLYLQSKSIQDEKTRALFNDSRNRVKSMALVHETLYQSGDLSRLNFATYIRNLIAHVFRSYRGSTGGIASKVNVSDVSLSIEAAAPCGLIINELVTNALKYAFPDKKGEIRIEMDVDESDRFVLVVSDNGIGLPKDFDVQNATSLGLRLVNSLVDQLDGTLELQHDEGTTFKIVFTEPEYTRRV